MTARLQPSDLTFLAEQLGRRSPPPLRWLELLTWHRSPLVREGAVYGLAPHVTVPGVLLVLRSIATADPSQGVRDAAREALET